MDGLKASDGSGKADRLGGEDGAGSAGEVPDWSGIRDGGWESGEVIGRGVCLGCCGLRDCSGRDGSPLPDADGSR